MKTKTSYVVYDAVGDFAEFRSLREARKERKARLYLYGRVGIKERTTTEMVLVKPTKAEDDGL